MEGVPTVIVLLCWVGSTDDSTCDSNQSQKFLNFEAKEEEEELILTLPSVPPRCHESVENGKLFVGDQISDH